MPSLKSQALPRPMEKHKQRAKSDPPPACTRTAMILAIMLVALTAAVYWQAAGFGLLNYDDNEYVTENLHVTAGLSGKGVVWAFTGRHAAYWAPLTWISLMLDSQVVRELIASAAGAETALSLATMASQSTGCSPSASPRLIISTGHRPPVNVLRWSSLRLTAESRDSHRA